MNHQQCRRTHLKTQNTKRNWNVKFVLYVFFSIFFKQKHPKIILSSLFQAKETPEPEYDLSECNLKSIPPGVFIMCKVLRKESLLLNCNKLTSLEGGGSLLDLNLLQVLNLNDNKLKKLPDQIGALTQLKELFLSKNILEKLPSTISRLTKLQILDISHNLLTTIELVACMPELKILNLSGNPKLQKLHNELSTCDSLSDLILDSEYFNYPPASVLELGTNNILKFLSTGEFTLNLPVVGNDGGTSNSATAKLKNFIENEKREVCV
jgi:E3 ubiquitin-protein ligase LRSAM1